MLVVWAAAIPQLQAVVVLFVGVVPFDYVVAVETVLFLLRALSPRK